jgi:hypothetical protein
MKIQQSTEESYLNSVDFCREWGELSGEIHQRKSSLVIFPLALATPPPPSHPPAHAPGGGGLGGQQKTTSYSVSQGNYPKKMYGSFSMVVVDRGQWSHFVRVCVSLAKDAVSSPDEIFLDWYGSMGLGVYFSCNFKGPLKFLSYPHGKLINPLYPLKNGWYWH